MMEQKNVANNRPSICNQPHLVVKGDLFEMKPNFIDGRKHGVKLEQF